MLTPEYGRCPVCSSASKEIVYYDDSAMCKNCRDGLQKLHNEILALEKDNCADCSCERGMQPCEACSNYSEK